MKKTIIITLAILSTLSISGRVAAQQKIFLDLNECRTMAVDSNRQMVSARLLEQKTLDDKKSIRSYFLPKISGYGMYLYSQNTIDYHFAGAQLPISGINVTIPPMDFSIDPSNSFILGVRADQPIFMGGKIVSAYKMAGIGLEMARLNTQMQRSEVIVAVDEAYWIYVKTCQLSLAADSFRETVDAIHKVVSDAVEIGMATNNDLLKVEVQCNNAKLMQSKARNGKMLAKMNLCHNIGLPLTSEVEVDQTGFGALESTDTVSGTIADRFDYQLLGKEVELKEREIALKRADYLPQLGVSAQYGYLRGLKMKDDLLLDDNGLTAIASLKIPIFAWGEGIYKLRSAEKEKEMKINEMERLEEMMALEEAKYRFAVADAQLQVELTNSSLESAERNMKVSSDQYELGMETLSNVLEAQTQWNKAKSDYIEAVAEYKLSYTKYLKTVGRL